MCINTCALDIGVVFLHATVSEYPDFKLNVAMVREDAVIPVLDRIVRCKNIPTTTKEVVLIFDVGGDYVRAAARYTKVEGFGHGPCELPRPLRSANLH